MSIGLFYLRYNTLMKKILLLTSILILSACAQITKPDDVAAQKTVIALVTDIDHCATRNNVSLDYLNQITTRAAEYGSQALISLGDNVSHRLGDCSESAETDLPFVINTLRDFPGENIFVLGDHDIASSRDSAVFWSETTAQPKNYFSRNIGDVHVIVLDTILGGDDMATSCEEDPYCASLKQRLADSRAIDRTSVESESLKQEYNALLKEKKVTRNSSKRDVGRIGQEQLDWLESDLAATSLTKVLIVSDHPLFPFDIQRKSYNIEGQVEVEKILIDAAQKHDREVIAISGEAHVWHHEKRNAINYYVLNENKGQNSWALLEWDHDPIVTKVINNQKSNKL